MKIPEKQDVVVTSQEDPVEFYYKFGIRNFYLKRLEMILKLLGGRKFNNILEIGYGSGIFLLELSKRCKNLYGIDLHDKTDSVNLMLQKLGVKTNLIKGDILNIPFDNEMFDCVICISILEHVQDLRKAISEINRVLCEKGIAVIGFPVKNFFTNLAFDFVGFDFRTEHIHTHSQILNEIIKHMVTDKLIKFPSFFPLHLSFYITCRLVKKV